MEQQPTQELVQIISTCITIISGIFIVTAAIARLHFKWGTAECLGRAYAKLDPKDIESATHIIRNATIQLRDLDKTKEIPPVVTPPVLTKRLSEISIVTEHPPPQRVPTIG